MENQKTETEKDITFRMAFKKESPRRPHKNLTKFWLEHEENYYDYDDFFDH